MLEWEKSTVRSMAQIILSSNASSAVTLLNGSAGELLTSVKNVILDKIMETTCQGNLKVNYLSVQAQKGVL